MFMLSKEPGSELRSMFDDFFNETGRSFNHLLRTNIKEDEKVYTLEIEVPGYDKKDLSISLDDGYLIISAKREEKVEDSKYLRKEMFYGTASRKYYVGNIDESKIDASYKDGILFVSVPKETKEEEKKIITIK